MHSFALTVFYLISVKPTHIITNYCITLRRRVGALHLLLLIASLMSASPTTILHAENQKTETLTIMLDWFVNPNHAALLAARYSGAFQRHHLDVKLLSPSDPAMSPRVVAAKQADLAITYQSSLSYIAQSTLPLVRVGTLIDTPLTVLITADDIKSLRDLKGKKIGQAGSDLSPDLVPMLKTVGLTTKDVTLVNVNFQLVQALMSGAVSAIIGGQKNYELLELRQRGYKIRAYYPENYGMPLYDELIFVAHKDRVFDPRISRFMVALQEATVDLLDHSEQYWDMAITDYPELNTALNHEAWIDTQKWLAKTPYLLDKKKYLRMHLYMQEIGQIDKDVTIDDHIADPVNQLE